MKPNAIEQTVIDRLSRFNQMRATHAKLKNAESQDPAAMEKLKRAIDVSYRSTNKHIQGLINSRLMTQKQLDGCYIAALQQSQQGANT